MRLDAIWPHIWTVAGALIFFVGVYALATGRLGVGLICMIGCVVCLSGSLAAQRRLRKRDARRR
ncbi:hypothetical protein SAMN06295974_0800 [Plantibacter flavus]|uniref:Uncharacterized protein n=1 Tax=Plantibacter flavus TaxID=150123 RepID=A0A3N2C246_9MICO|nr:hypothetical protein [Plantibacter flavus]ROR81562.1 hypothetical protein EDD42_1626 [Plantibacter flavus]SMG14247.1 hypothetical protein SAMN06295974_0800 [Plantibacter flavus]